MTPATEARCLGCGRPLVPGGISCLGCGRPLGGGDPVPPGWVVASPPEVARRAAAPAAVGAVPATSPPPATLGRGAAASPPPGQSPFRPPAADGELGRPSYVMNPSWRLRPRVAPGALAANSTMPQFTVPRIVAPPPARPRRRAWASALYWTLVGGILASSAAAFLLLTAHMVGYH